MKRSVSVQKSKVKAVVKKAQDKTFLKVLSLAKPKLLLAWYDRHRRVMPWRALPGTAPNPYFVWLSEIMLQQTTVATVGAYFKKFVNRWPQLKSLAAASPDDIMRMWAGLGYYRRARFLHECAQHLVHVHKGLFPQSEKELLKLPGFGPYTAAAVASIAFDQRANVVDGNVERVMARLFAVRGPLPEVKKELRDLAAALLPAARYGDYAQALMDLGATICTPRNPKCDLCPWEKACEAYRQGIADQLPQRGKVKVKPIRRAIAFVLRNKKGEIFLRQRPKNGLLGSMMEVPTSAWQETPMPVMGEVIDQAPLMASWSSKPGIVRHIFSHFELQISVVTAVTSKSLKGGKWVAPSDLDKEALPSLMYKIIGHA